MSFKLIAALLLGLSVAGNLQAQMNTKNPNGTYNPNAYSLWKSDQDLKKNQQSMNDALAKSAKSKTSEASSSSGSSGLYIPIQSAADAANNDKCISGNCVNGIGTWQKDPYYATDDYHYIGEFKNGQREGKGKSYDWQGYLRYEGDWVDGSQDGLGRSIEYRHERIRDGDKHTLYTNLELNNVYEGFFKNGRREGKGKLFYYGGLGTSIFDGNFIYDKKDGFGTYITFFSQDELYAFYSGNWKDDKYDGQGVDSTANDGLYIGNFKAGERDGEGISYWQRKRTDTGTLKVKYNGNWKEGKQDGFGSEYDIKGKELYEGNFKNGVREGTGKQYKADGSFTEGKWINGVNEALKPDVVTSSDEIVFSKLEDERFMDNHNFWLSYDYKDKGMYTVHSQKGSNREYKENFSSSFLVEKTENWTLEVELKKVSGPVSGEYGIGWGNDRVEINSFGEAFFLSKSNNGQRICEGPQKAGCKKGGYNTIKVIRKGPKVEVRINGKLINSCTYKEVYSDNLFLYLSGEDATWNFKVAFKRITLTRE